MGLGRAPDWCTGISRRYGGCCFLSPKAAISLSIIFLSAGMSSAMASGRGQTDTLEYLCNEGTLCQNPSTEAREWKESGARLPTSIRPLRYLLRLQPLMNNNFTIIGYVEITIEVLERTSNITLHIADIITKNDTIKLTPANNLTGPGVPITEHLYDQPRDFYIANLGEELVAGQQYVLAMEFHGYLNDQMAGFYRSQYKKEDGTTTWLAATMFSPTHAREAFPCFDEPALKAEFEVYLARQTNMSAISNMPRIDTLPFDDDPDWVWDHFNTTLPMSTFLVAFIVSDFTFINSTYNDHVLFRVWAREDAIGDTEYALEAGPAILTWYEEYFNISFPLPKEDMIALPDSSVGAMENWGLVTFRESALLYDPVMSSASDKEGVASVVGHELAHQWFGDLVTMEWWSDVWLKEGFASYLQYLSTNFFEPSWNRLDQFVISDLHPVFGMDSLESSHPISMPVEYPDDISQLFDSITYSKGASINRMMDHFLTERTYRDGLNLYLTNNAYSNAAQDDLWQALTEQAHADNNLPQDLTVKTIMDTWTLQMGYPVITVKLNGDGTATLTQERFLMVKNPNSTDTHNYKWWVPITFTGQHNTNFSQTKPIAWMTPTDECLPVSGMPADGNWVIFNLQETGYYRVNYEPSNWQIIINQLLVDHSIINLINRAQLIDDALNLARAGRLSYEIALSINSYLSKDIEYVPWKSALSSLDYLESMFTRTGGYGQLKQYLLSLLTPLYKSVGFEDDVSDPHLEQKMRAIALSWSCSLGLDDCVTNSVNLYSQWMASPENKTIISPNQKLTVYCTGIAEGSEAEWNFAWSQYLATSLATEESAILYALACSKDIGTLSGYLDMAFTEGSGIRKQDSGSVFSAVASNDVGRDLAWNYLKDNIEQISLYYKTFSAVGKLISSATVEFNTNEELTDLLQFKADYGAQLGTASMAIDQSIERTANNIDWMNNYYQIIVSWLQDNGYPPYVKFQY